MRRFFVKNLFFILAVNVLVKPAWFFFIDRIVQNRVGNAAYGSYQAIFNFTLILQIILDFGISNYNSRTIAQDPDKLKSLFPVMLSARFVLMAIYTLTVFVIGWIIGIKGWLLMGIVLIQFFNMLLLYVRSNVAALHHFKVDGILSVSYNLLMILVCGFLLVYPATAHRFRIEWFVLAQVGCYSIAIIAAFIVLKRIYPISLRLSFNGKMLSKVVKESLPYATLIFLMSIYMRVDMLLVEKLCPNGKEQTGIYAAAYRLLDVCNTFGLMFAAMLLPLFGRMLIQKKNVQPIVRVSADIIMPISYMIAVAGVFFGSPIMHLLYTAPSAQSGLIFAWLMVSFPAFSILYVYSTLLTANGDLILLNKLAVFGVIINLGLNFYFIPHYQAVGAAFVTFVTQTALAIGFAIFSVKKINLPVNSGWL
ncbi:MAG TPA: oligosaccharide flippase family protein, partial [Flavipsychrobacter sp.]|nr:oligosaccharide flippase family protein [Flavipsychrobacter sp.]